MKKKICIYAACDRFNYGDLLFPIILNVLLNRRFRNDYDIKIFGTTKSNLSKFGAICTTPVSQLFKSGYLTNDSVIIIGGGEVLPISWESLHRHLSGFFVEVYHVIRKILQRTPAINNRIQWNEISRRILCTHLKYPFLLSTLHFKPRVKIIYNTIGCRNISLLTTKEKNVFKQELLKTTYLSVRDKKSRQALTEIGIPGADIHLAPDSAIAIAEIFPKNNLKNLINSEETKKFILKNQNAYICFQVSYAVMIKNKALIVEQLEKLYYAKNIPIVLLPIGRANYHWDQRALKVIKRALKIPVIMPINSTVIDIMGFIAFSKIFIGTSLHGNITALAYGVPFIALGQKARAFMQSWGISEKEECASAAEFANKVDSVIAIPMQIRYSKRDELLRLYKKSFGEMIEVIRK